MQHCINFSLFLMVPTTMETPLQGSLLLLSIYLPPSLLNGCHPLPCNCYPLLPPQLPLFFEEDQATHCLSLAWSDLTVTLHATPTGVGYLVHQRLILSGWREALHDCVTSGMSPVMRTAHMSEIFFYLVSTYKCCILATFTLYFIVQRSV